MAYTPTNWVTGQTPLSAANLNNIEQGISDLNSKITEVDEKIIIEQQLITYANNWTSIYKSGYSLLAIYAIRSDVSYVIQANRRSDGVYLLYAPNAANTSQQVQCIWIKN